MYASRSVLEDQAVFDILRHPAQQQPQWRDDTELQYVRQELESRPALVDANAVYLLRSVLAEVSCGERHVVQAGDCAENPEECTADHVARKVRLLNILAEVMKINTRKPVVLVGRMAGQFGKPRSKPTEQIGSLELPVYRGHMVNSPEPDPVKRQPDPQHLLSCYQMASEVVDHLGWRTPSKQLSINLPVWTSHEALLLDYEIPMLRRDNDGRLFLASTHWPWIGERTRQVDGAHVALLANVVNPVACKVGPSTMVSELLSLCERLDPGRESGRLTLITRMGAEVVADLLPPLIEAVRAEGHPVIWLCDPMHANTVTTPNGLKTRFVEKLVREIQNFQGAVRASDSTAGGLHLETTPDDITECVPNESNIDQASTIYTSLCDPRLNPRQAVSVVSAWSR